MNTAESHSPEETKILFISLKQRLSALLDEIGTATENNMIAVGSLKFAIENFQILKTEILEIKRAFSNMGESSPPWITSLEPTFDAIDQLLEIFQQPWVSDCISKDKKWLDLRRIRDQHEETAEGKISPYTIKLRKELTPP